MRKSTSLLEVTRTFYIRKNSNKVYGLLDIIDLVF